MMHKPTQPFIKPADMTESERKAGLAPGSGSTDTYQWWVMVILLMVAALITCVVLDKGMAAIAIALVINAAVKIQIHEDKR
jgi:hypothetical protein